jgi:hypothetical protein
MVGGMIKKIPRILATYFVDVKGKARAKPERKRLWRQNAG